MFKSCEDTQMSFYEAKDSSSPLLPLSFDEWEAEARKKLGAGPFGYVHGGAGGGETMEANLSGFRQYQIRPRVCSNVSKRDLGIVLFGQQASVPFLMAPIGVNSIVHPVGELGAARAAANLNVPYVLSNVSTHRMEEVAEVMGHAMRWFQLYPPKNEELMQSFLQRAEKAGFTAIVVTVDSTLLGWRITDLKNRYLPFLEGHGMGNYFSDPVFRDMLKQSPEDNRRDAVLRALDEGNNTCFTWKTLTKVRERTKLPLLLKGLTHPEDALLALEHGADGVIVSNHGGRQLDGAIGTMEALPEVLKTVNGKAPVLLDGGIRRGADIIKALALGATAVQVGRPYMYALAVAGQSGVEYMLQNLIAETELQLAISGNSSVKDLDCSLLRQV
ncbi:alpha-hydroxy-acid oxidizing protein [Paenibacillus sambharensis]|nr:alpha-hydroxy-acid oxidizing protein [Paenibacillus sambharensis]